MSSIEAGQIGGRCFEQLHDVLFRDRRQHCPLGIFALQLLQLALDRGPFLFQFIDLFVHRARRLHFKRGGRAAFDLAGDCARGSAPGFQLVGRRMAGGEFARLARQGLGEVRGGQIGEQFVHQPLIQGLRGDFAAFAGPVVPAGAIAMPGGSRWRYQQAGEQVGMACRALAAVRIVFKVIEQGFGLGRSDERRVGIFLDDPLRARTALHAAFVPAADAFAMHVPDRMPGIGQRVPLDADQRGFRHRRRHAARQFTARKPGQASAQVLGDRRRAVGRHQA